MSIPHETSCLYLIYTKGFLIYISYGQFFYMCYRQTFMSILGVEKLSILCIDNIYTYDVEKTKISTSHS